jgi:hypothetical protein
MKRFFCFAALAAAVMAVPSSHLLMSQGKAPEKVAVCHKGQVIHVSENALQAHVTQLGGCTKDTDPVLQIKPDGSCVCVPRNCSQSADPKKCCFDRCTVNGVTDKDCFTKCLSVPPPQPTCQEKCDADYKACVDKTGGDPDGTCKLIREKCLIGCPPPPPTCQEKCDADYKACVDKTGGDPDGTCKLIREKCITGCGVK